MMFSSKRMTLILFFDELNVSRIDFGGGLSKKTCEKAGKLLHLQSIAFCDQNRYAFRANRTETLFSPDQLLDMADKGWGEEKNGATISLESLIELSREEKQYDKDGAITRTPGRYIEIYEVHGNLPKKFANSSDMSGKYGTYLFIVAFYQKKNSDEKSGVILYVAPEKKAPLNL